MKEESISSASVEIGLSWVANFGHYLPINHSSSMAGESQKIAVQRTKLKLIKLSHGAMLDGPMCLLFIFKLKRPRIVLQRLNAPTVLDISRIP